MKLWVQTPVPPKKKMFITTLYIRTKKWNQHTFSLIVEWMIKVIILIQWKNTQQCEQTTAIPNYIDESHRQNVK
jgi:hypothetical protein